MEFLYANPFTLAFHYLLLYFAGESLDSLHSKFLNDVKENSLADLQAGSTAERQHAVFDFIIVGGGSAGSVLANRLSEENNSVLLLEAGGHPFPLTAIPMLCNPLLNHPNIDWHDETVPQKHACQALSNKASRLSHGKVLGGSSTLNYMIAMRGHPNDFNNWARETNDSSWSYSNVLKYFRKMESYHGSFPNDIFHGSEGPIHISKQNYDPLLSEWLEAGKELGYPTSDPNGKQTESFFPLDLTTQDGRRSSTNQAYILPAINRPNLHIKTYSHATKIHFDSNKRAVGVAYSRQSQQHYASAAKEIIVSAGAIGSPHLLMLSGVGPKEQLKQHGIPLISDLPVGKNFQDHVYSCIGPFIVDSGRSLNTERDLNMDNLLRYISNGEGPFSSMAIVGGAIKSSSIALPGWPDMFVEIFAVAVTDNTVTFFQDTLGVRPGIMQKYFAKDYGKDAFFIVNCLGLVKSRGQVKLRSNSPFDRPEIDPMYFSHPDDFQTMMEGVKFALQIGQTEAFRNVGARLTTSLFPGCEKFGNATNDAYWECYLRQWSHTIWHFSSTARMGKVDNPNSVVDSKLRVLGTQNLRVVDASVMPKVPISNINLPTIMIGEKGADLIKETWAGE